MARGGIGLLRHARLTRKQIIMFALLSAALNGIITASVGAWLGQTYARYQARRQSIDSIVQLVYERRTRAGMVASALRRGADVEEIRFRKRAYDEAYVAWNTSIMRNIFAIREVTGEHMISSLEGYFQDHLVASLADIDRCLTKAYDARLSNGDAKAILDDCRMSKEHQFVLDCGATFTNELYKLSKLSFIPLAKTSTEGREISERRIATSCTRPEVALPKPPTIALPPTGPPTGAATGPATEAVATPALPILSDQTASDTPTPLNNATPPADTPTAATLPVGTPTDRPPPLPLASPATGQPLPP